jgi:hypothetical protein
MVRVRYRWVGQRTLEQIKGRILEGSGEGVSEWKHCEQAQGLIICDSRRLVVAAWRLEDTSTLLVTVIMTTAPDAHNVFFKDICIGPELRYHAALRRRLDAGDTQRLQLPSRREV